MPRNVPRNVLCTLAAAANRQTVGAWKSDYWRWADVWQGWTFSTRRHSFDKLFHCCNFGLQKNKFNCWSFLFINKWFTSLENSLLVLYGIWAIDFLSKTIAQKTSYWLVEELMEVSICLQPFLPFTMQTTYFIGRKLVCVLKHFVKLLCNVNVS